MSWKWCRVHVVQEGGSDAVFNQLMQQLPALVTAMHTHLQPWADELVVLVRRHWEGPLLLQV